MERYFELPFTATGQLPLRPDLDLVSLVARGAEHSYVIDVTILDAKDLRLTRAGVRLAHRVRDERGEWYLSAPAWGPHLASEQVEPMGDPELPVAFAEAVLPFRRRAPLEPVGALHCVRDEFVIRGADRQDRAVLIDDRIALRRGGVTVSRYRELTLKPIELGRKQLGWLTETIRGLGGERLEGPTDWAHRLGVHASLLEAPGVAQLPATADAESFASALITQSLRNWIAADLALRTGARARPDELVEVVAGLRGEIRGLATVLEPVWVADIDQEFHWLLTALAEVTPGPSSAAGLLRTERYLHLLDLVHQAAAVPRLGSAATAPAADLVTGSVQRAVQTFAKAARALSAGDPAEDWIAVAALAEQLRATAAVARHREPQWARRIDKRARKLLALLEDCVDTDLDRLQAEVPELDAAAAFEAGRRYEQLARAQARARQHFLTEWTPQAEKLRSTSQSVR